MHFAVIDKSINSAGTCGGMQKAIMIELFTKTTIDIWDRYTLCVFINRRFT